MSCVSQALSGLVQDCSNSMGGIRRVLITTDEPKPKVETGAITSFENTSAVWHEYNFKKNTGSMTSTLNVDVANGINYVSTELILQFNKMETTKRIEMVGLSTDDMYIIVEDCNGTYWFLGYDEPVTASAGTSQTGTAKTDGNFYNITLMDEADSFPYEVVKSAVPVI